MANNLHVSYDLYAPGQNYEAVIKAVKELGDWANVHKSFWYVNSRFTAAQAVDHVWKVMDKNDKIYVVDATNKNAAWQNLSVEVATFIQIQWLK
jgi:hypothetical protein